MYLSFFTSWKVYSGIGVIEKPDQILQHDSWDVFQSQTYNAEHGQVAGETGIGYTDVNHDYFGRLLKETSNRCVQNVTVQISSFF